MSEPFIATINPNTNEVSVPLETPVLDIAHLELEAISFPAGLRGLRDKDTAVNLANWMARPRLIASGDSTSPGFAFGSFAIWKAIPAVNSLLSQWRFFRGDLKLTINVTGGSQYNGLWRLVASPKVGVNAYAGAQSGYGIGSLTSEAAMCVTSQLPHVDIDLAVVKTYTLDLPYCRPEVYVDMLASEEIWALHMIPIFTPTLASGLTPNPIVLNVYAAFENVELNVVIPQSGEGPPRILSSLLNYTSLVASALPFPWATPFSVLAGSAGKLAHLAGYSRPPIESESQVVNRMTDNWALTSGQPTLGYSLATNPGVVRTIDPGVIPLSVEGETTFRSIVNRTAMIRSDVYAGATPADTPVILAAVAPGVQMDDGLSFALTPTGFAASMFEKWSGDLEFCVQVTCSPLIRWRIGILIVPPNFTPPASFPTTGEHLSYTMEIAGSTCLDIVVPYLYQPTFTDFELVPVTASALTRTRIYIYSLTEAQGPAATPVYPFVSLWMKAGPTFSVGIPNMDIMNDYRFSAQSAIGAVSLSTFGEYIDDLTILTRRPVNWLRVVEAAGPRLGNLVVSVNPVAPTGSTYYAGAFYGWSYLNYFASAFLGQTGGIVVRVVSGNPTGTILYLLNTFGTVVDTPPTAGRAGYLQTSRGCQLSYNEPGEVVVPDRNPLMFRNTRATVPTSTAPHEVLRIYGVEATTSTFDIWASGADDFRVGGFMCVPLFTPR